MGMLTMRYLLAFYSETTSQWRCLDTALLPVPVPGPEDIPGVLHAFPAITLQWMLERRELGPFESTGGETITDAVLVYRLEADGSPIGAGTDYLGAWLEMFMQSHQPMGTIRLLATSQRAQIESFDALRGLVAAPLQARDEACQQTMDLMRDYAAVPIEEVAPDPEIQPQESV
ncbi:hypothetical protein [Celeribacter indicus]|uniref:Uncharacterized protein n=1 Tax=Celeribacter indicus TaxID=1208324 RepID=A0A0B5DX63_9RHOB|nr:hypothetical protein [Celeribacter indicus]AJE45665.1 hypothetical protein P73_0950 [Celeribacter indicus]SDX30596.1 hypothetical protein SAMN05443573_1212 [Celeribacter indicus]